jgi:hypothetical protein
VPVEEYITTWRCGKHGYLIAGNPSVFPFSQQK